MMVDNLTEPSAIQDPSAASIERLLAHGQALLRERGDAPRLQAEVLLAHTLGQPRSYLIAHDRSPVPAALEAAYRALLERAAHGEPIAYLTGEREFWSLPLRVSPAVLIPRPETELAVARCLALLGASSPARVCDLGTGCGPIALALASERPGWQIVATDCSAAALAVAQSNAERLDLRQVEFLHGNWLTPLGARRFDLIVSNPPYVADCDPALHALRFEPRVALTPGPTGLEALRPIVAEARAHLAVGGWLVLEHGADQAHELASLLHVQGYTEVRCHRDLADRSRVTEARRP